MTTSVVDEVGIFSLAVHVPPETRSAGDLLRAEGGAFDEATMAALGIERVHVCGTETGSELGLSAAREAIRGAGIDPHCIDVIVDYTVMPQDYLVPAWSMSNKLQHELGATKAFTIGFSGGLSSSLNASLHFVGSLMRCDESVNTALLVASDKAIPGNRVLGGAEPFTLLGDGASAMVVKRGAGLLTVVDSELWTDGAMHDICHIPGGAMAMPDRGDLYRFQFDRSRFKATAKFRRLRDLALRLLDRHGLGLSDICFFDYANLSAADQEEFSRAFEAGTSQRVGSTLSQFGHIHATDLVLNLNSALDSGAIQLGGRALLLSHGMGFTYGVTLLERRHGLEGPT